MPAKSLVVPLHVSCSEQGGAVVRADGLEIKKVSPLVMDVNRLHQQQGERNMALSPPDLQRCWTV